jgi:hypothetical protein
MKEVLNLSIAKLKRILVLKAKIERLQGQLENLASDSTAVTAKIPGKKKRTMSAAARKKISQAAKARWAKFHAAKKSK